jgi:hypothetical protein
VAHKSPLPQRVFGLKFTSRAHLELPVSARPLPRRRLESSLLREPRGDPVFRRLSSPPLVTPAGHRLPPPSRVPPPPALCRDPHRSPLLPSFPPGREFAYRRDDCPAAGDPLLPYRARPLADGWIACRRKIPWTDGADPQPRQCTAQPCGSQVPPNPFPSSYLLCLWILTCVLASITGNSRRRTYSAS